MSQRGDTPRQQSDEERGSNGSDPRARRPRGKANAAVEIGRWFDSNVTGFDQAEHRLLGLTEALGTRIAPLGVALDAARFQLVQLTESVEFGVFADMII